MAACRRGALETGQAPACLLPFPAAGHAPARHSCAFYPPPVVVGGGQGEDGKQTCMPGMVLAGGGEAEGRPRYITSGEQGTKAEWEMGGPHPSLLHSPFTLPHAA